MELLAGMEVLFAHISEQIAHILMLLAGQEVLSAHISERIAKIYRVYRLWLTAYRPLLKKMIFIL
ncbi:hypothetical protein BPO_0045 [Bergeyella porcorum]|uniref:Uncharacterized protein n=1 Tax=Bergeyella porcorum TaxID=1735111 RepID=A0AAU0F056_9FLAO